MENEGWRMVRAVVASEVVGCVCCCATDLLLLLIQINC